MLYTIRNHSQKSNMDGIDSVPNGNHGQAIAETQYDNSLADCSFMPLDFCTNQWLYHIIHIMGIWIFDVWHGYDEECWTPSS